MTFPTSREVRASVYNRDVLRTRTIEGWEYLKVRRAVQDHRSSSIAILDLGLVISEATNMSDIADTLKIREKYSHFRVLVIGRANAGKTTLLKRVCNTTDEPCIYDEESNNLVSFTGLSPSFVSKAYL